MSAFPSASSPVGGNPVPNVQIKLEPGVDISVLGIENEFDERIQKVLDGFDRPYDPTVEIGPKLAAFHPSFQCAEQSCNDIVARAKNLIEQSKYEDEETKQLLEDMKRIETIKYPLSSKVALIGDSGVGQYYSET